jgi:hypothetical protein
LAKIERSENAVALGTASEQQAWRDLTAMESKLALVAGDPAAEELRDKQRFLKGLLLWDLRRDYKARLWAQKSSLRELDRSLKEAQRRHHQVETAREQWPETFHELTDRIAGLAPRVLGLHGSVQTALLRQQDFLRDVAVAELQAQRDRLDTYRVQARFALASIYDRAAAREAAPGARSTPLALDRVLAEGRQ